MKVFNLFILTTSFVLSFFIFDKTILSPSFSAKNSNTWKSVIKKIDTKPNTFFLHSPTLFVPQASAAESYENAKAYIAIDADTGTVLASKNANTSLSIASLTKIMSSIVALDLEKPQTLITISSKSTQTIPTKIGVVVGQQMTIDELLHAMLMTSANDAAQAVADGINNFYGQNIFVKAMNEKARFLGLESTHFANPQGFDDVHNKSSVHDLAVLSVYAMHTYPLIFQIADLDYVQLPQNSYHKQFDLYNWNGLLDVYPGTTGLKIGNTDDAGYTNIVTSTRNGHTILIVMLGAPGILERDMWSASLLDDTFNHAFSLPPINITTQKLEEKYATWRYW